MMRHFTIDGRHRAKGRQMTLKSMGPGWLPSLKDLADWVSFAPATGRIWFDKQRSLLMHANTFGARLFKLLGCKQARARS